MKSFIATADVHLGHKLYNFPELERDFNDNFARICSVAITHQVDYLVVAGDLFDDNNPRPDIVSWVRQQSDRLKKENIELVGLAGDHDEPINNATWCRVAGVKSVNEVEEFLGLDYYDYSREDWWEKLVNQAKSGDPHPRCAVIRWIFLHGQVPSLFRFVEAKKKLDFGEVPLLETFPNLQGVILGDIHTPLDGHLLCKDREIYIGYCGSPSINDASEISHEKQLIHVDSNGVLKKIPFHQERAFVKIPFQGAEAESFSIEPYQQLYGKATYKPVFVVETDKVSMQNYGAKLRPLYDLGLVRRSDKGVKKKDDNTEEQVNIRSELATESKMVDVLQKLCEEHDVGNEGYSLALSLLADNVDSTLLLDNFKLKKLTCPTPPLATHPQQPM